MQLTIRGAPSDDRRSIVAKVARLKRRPYELEYTEHLELLEGIPEGNTLRISSFWPAVEYLNDRYPFPALYMGHPVQDALVRTLCETLFTNRAEVMKNLRPPIYSGSFLTGPAPILLDLVVNQLIPVEGEWEIHGQSLLDFMSENDE